MIRDEQGALRAMHAAARARRARLDRRLRHRLLVAQPARGVPDRHAQDPEAVRRPARRRRHATSSTRSCGSPARSAWSRSPRASSTSRRRSALRELGCGLGQGYLFSRPIRAGDVVELLPRTAARPARRGRRGLSRAHAGRISESCRSAFSRRRCRRRRRRPPLVRPHGLVGEAQPAACVRVAARAALGGGRFAGNVVSSGRFCGDRWIRGAKGKVRAAPPPSSSCPASCCGRLSPWPRWPGSAWSQRHWRCPRQSRSGRSASSRSPGRHTGG